MRYLSKRHYCLVEGFFHKNSGLSDSGVFYGACLHDDKYYFQVIKGPDALKASRSCKEIVKPSILEDAPMPTPGNPGGVPVQNNPMGTKEEPGTLNELDKPVPQLNPKDDDPNSPENLANKKYGVEVMYMGDDLSAAGRRTDTGRYVKLNPEHATYKVGDTVELGDDELLGDFSSLGQAIDNKNAISKPIKPLSSESKVKVKNQIGSESKEYNVRYLNEDGFKEGPSGDGKMDNYGGTGVAKKSLGKVSADNGGEKTSEMGKEWPRKQKNTGGTFETEQESPSGSAPEPNSEPHKKHSGDMGSKLGQNNKQKNKGASMEEVPGTGHEMQWKKVGGESVPQESKSPVQALFDAYARRNTYVTVEDFNTLCSAYNLGSVNEDVFSALMARNSEFLFIEGQDAGGRFWYATISESMDMGGAKAQNQYKAGQGPDGQERMAGLPTGLGTPAGKKSARMNRFSDASNDREVDGGISQIGESIEDDEFGPEEDEHSEPMNDVDPAGVGGLADEAEAEEGMEGGLEGGVEDEMGMDGMDDMEGGIGDGLDDEMDMDGGMGMDDEMGPCAGGECDDIEAMGAEIGARVAKEVAANMGKFGMDDDIDGFDAEEGEEDTMGSGFEHEGALDYSGGIDPDDGLANDMGNGTDMMADDSSTTGGLALGAMGGPEGEEEEGFVDDEDLEHKEPGRPRPFEGRQRRKAVNEEGDVGAADRKFPQRLKTKSGNKTQVGEVRGEKEVDTNKVAKPKDYSKAGKKGNPFSPHIVKSEGACPSCKTIMDEIGCPKCGLLRETHEMGLDGSHAKADEHGTYTTDDTKKLKSPDPDGEVGLSQDGDELKSSKGKESGSPEVKELRSDKLGNNSAMKNTVDKLKENVERLSAGAKKFITEAAKKMKKPGKFKPQFTVKGKGVQEHRTESLTGAMTDAEELIQACGAGNVNVEVAMVDSSGGIAFKSNMPLVTITPRGALASEGKVWFRYPEVANAYAKAIVEEGYVCRVSSHNWGAAVSGKVPSKLILNAYNL